MKTTELIRLRKRLKYPLKKVAEVMPKGFTDEAFVSFFKEIYPSLWVELENRYQSHLRVYNSRRQNGLKAIYPLSSRTLILDVAKVSLQKSRNEHSTDEYELEKSKGLEKLLNSGKRKAHKIREIDAKRIRQFQEVTPDYVNNLIKEYFNIRRKNTLDVNSRYLIILECAKFKCEEIISFLEKINACEKNDELRQLAYRILCSFGLTPKLSHKRNGRKKLSATKVKDLDENPSELIQRIYDNQHKIHKHFDVFLSHSYGRQTELLEVKESLNRQGLVVYVDWINDAEMLAREKQNNDTFKVLYERLRQSSSLLFIQTKSSVTSPYCSKEIEFFKKLGRPMYILEAEKVENRPPFFDDLTLIKQIDKRILVDGETLLSKGLIDVSRQSD
ncbi:hypothetical protein [Parabacteroides sp. ZJ-118]|uniref:hypothetical protein n=1 Tax=Parabacteroides sp. ZJ-118 TaxID=2709398 RepID=UPI00197EB71D|nr:hypothetical protein [Parabacteroides sp. ZJ-118]